MKTIEVPDDYGEEPDGETTTWLRFSVIADNSDEREVSKPIVDGNGKAWFAPRGIRIGDGGGW